jgi:hypothetical protein
VLDITAGTVKWHLKNIYSKFDGCNREQVLRRARALHLIHPVLPGSVPFELTVKRQQRLEVIARRLDEVTAIAAHTKSNAAGFQGSCGRTLFQVRPEHIPRFY